MANEIKPLFGTVTAFTVTVANIASSTSFVGQQSDMVDFSTGRVARLYVAASIKLGTSPTAVKPVYLFAIRSNKAGTAIRDDAAGASAAAWTRLNAGFMRRPDGRSSILFSKTGAATGDVLAGNFIFDQPGREAGIGWSHETGVNTDTTGGNHVISYYTENPEVQ